MSDTVAIYLVDQAIQTLTAVKPVRFSYKYDRFDNSVTWYWV